MLQEFITQDYLILQDNVVTNSVLWNGDTTQWTPPSGSIAIPLATTPAIIWVFDSAQNDFVLAEQLGQGQIGFTWDGSVLTTNQPKPPIK